ncbi:alpha/beta hydrolase [Micromonospora sp. CPCC 205371]|nr:alpha/beta hydrolase [Micromonospora sp. CPCC 205371]
MARGPGRRAIGGVLVGGLLLAAGILGVVSAGHGVRSTHAHVAGVPVEVVRPVGGGVGRPAVVVAHGYAGSGRLMRPFADTLARRGYVVALPDLAGHAGNARPLGQQDMLDRELAGIVRHVRCLSDVDAERVALLGHSMGAAAVVRAGAADRSIAATVAISLGDGAAAELRPGPHRLLPIGGAREPAVPQAIAGAAGAGVGRRADQVPLAEHVGVLYADMTHHETARWLDEALNHTPERKVIAAKQRVAAGGMSLAGTLLLVVAALAWSSRRGAPATAGSQPVRLLHRVPLAWPAGAVMAAPLSGLVGGWLLARALPSALCGYLTGYFAFAGATLGAAALVANMDRLARAWRRRLPWRGLVPAVAWAHRVPCPRHRTPALRRACPRGSIMDRPGPGRDLPAVAGGRRRRPGPWLSRARHAADRSPARYVPPAGRGGTAGRDALAAHRAGRRPSGRLAGRHHSATHLSTTDSASMSTMGPGRSVVCASRLATAHCDHAHRRGG